MEFLSKLNYQRRLSYNSEPEEPEHEVTEVQKKPSDTNTDNVKPTEMDLNSIESKPATSTSVGEVTSWNTNEFRIIMGDNFDTGPPVSIMRFINADVKPEKWRKCKMVREVRRNTIPLNSKSFQQRKEENKPPTEGAGSEFGAEAREEVKRLRRIKKYQRKEIKLEDKPWLLKIKSLDEDIKRFRGLKEGGVSDHTAYYIFSAKQQENEIIYEAFPVKNWYDFKCIPQHTNLTAEEAEEKFKKRHETYNYFSLMTRKRLEMADDNNHGETSEIKRRKGIESENDGGKSDSSFDEDLQRQHGKSYKRYQRRQKYNFSVESNDEYEGEQEVGYMTSSQSSTNDNHAEEDEVANNEQDTLNSSRSDLDEDSCATTFN